MAQEKLGLWREERVLTAPLPVRRRTAWAWSGASTGPRRDRWSLDHLPPLTWPCPPGDHLFNHWDELRPRIEALADSDRRRPADLSEVSLLSPVANPGKIVAAPVNYALHLDESRADTGINFGTEIKTIHDYGVFLKAPCSLIGAGTPVTVDWDDRRTDHEIELAVVIGKPGFRIAEADALYHVAGYMIGLDMTIRGTEDRSFRKSLDTFTVLGPHMVTADELGDPVRPRLRADRQWRAAAGVQHLAADPRACRSSSPMPPRPTAFIRAMSS